MKVSNVQLTMWPTVLRRNEVEKMDRYSRRKEKVLEVKKQQMINNHFDFKV